MVDPAPEYLCMLQRLPSSLKLLSFLFFHSYIVGFFLWFSKHFHHYCPSRKLLLCNSATCNMLHVTQPHQHGSYFEDTNEKILFPLSYSSKVSSLSFDAVVWICVSRGNAVAISFPSCEGSGQLPPPSQEGALSKKNANICLAWFLLKWHQTGFSEE